MEHPDARNEDFNLSTAQSTTVLELAEIIWRKIKGPGEPLRVVSDDPFEYDVKRRVPATEKAKRILGFEAATSLDADARRGNSLDRQRDRQRHYLAKFGSSSLVSPPMHASARAVPAGHSDRWHQVNVA